MLTFLSRTFVVLSLLLSLNAYADSPSTSAPFPEMEFVKEFSGKNADYIMTRLGKPYKKVVKENAGGIVEFWLYQNLVKQGSSDKIFKFTQIGIVWL